MKSKVGAKTKGAAGNRTIRKLVDLAQGLVREIDKGRNPSLDIPIRALSNVKFDEKRSIIELGGEKQKRYFFNVAMAKRFMQTLLVAEKCREHIHIGKTTSLRDLFYMVKHTMPGTNEDTVDEQQETDDCIEDLEVAIDELRESLGLYAMRKETAIGEITIEDTGDTIDLRRMGSGGWSVPSIVEPGVIRFKKSTAKFVLLVEKDAVWGRLNEDKFWRDHKCILVHGGGMAPRGVRRLIHRLVHELNLPLYVLTDNDPWGYYIYSVIKQGSINLAYESMRMAVPQARFLGIRCEDAEAYKIPREGKIRLTQQDIGRAKQILGYPWFQKKPWQAELKHMLKAGVKMEIEALSQRGITFLTDEYLPRKLKTKDWLD
jgi:DNA topoisomerase-6 subunit A